MTVRTRSRNLLAIALVVSFVGPACAGGTAEPRTADEAESEGRTSSSDEQGDDSSSDEKEADEGKVASKPACDDGTCTLCGDAQCPTGWYCDESAKGGPACGWLPECAKKPTCACVKKAYQGCSCEERAGSPHVTCS
jgi:hypothetical protein